MENNEEKVEKTEAASAEGTTSQSETSASGAAVAAVKPGFGQKIVNAFRDFFTKEHLKEFAKNHIFDICALGGLIICLIVFTVVPPLVNGPRASIWRPISIKTLISQISVYFILAIGAVFVYLMGCMDISVGYQVGVFGAVFIMIANSSNLFLALLTIIIMGLACAIFNAFVGAYVKLPTVMSSVILMQLFNGVLLSIFDDKGINEIVLGQDISVISSTWFRVLALVLLAIVAFYLLTFTKIGKRSRAIGTNKLAADQAGANLLKTRIICYCVFSVFLCLGAVMLIAKSNSIASSDTVTYQMDIMIMLLMGGMPLSGGMKGKLFNAIIGTFTYVLLNRGLSACSVPTAYIMLVKSLVFVIIVCLTCRKPGNLLPR
ncbi:MAG: ABC transporter permease [Roseburia sp.]|nr:ABC transporter permease [Roseburia sp.]